MTQRSGDLIRRFAIDQFAPQPLRGIVQSQVGE